MTITRTSPFLTQLSDRINEEMGKDFDVFFIMREKPSPENKELLERHECAIELIRDIDSVAALYPFCREVGIDLHLAHKPKRNGDLPAVWDMSAALVAAFHSQVRTPDVAGPVWVPHIYSAQNVCKAAESIEGEILACAARTVTIEIAKFGYPKPFEGFPVDVANNIRTWMLHTKE